MRLLKTSEYIIKKSRFISYLYEVETTDEVKEIYKKLWEENKKARHIPYAYMLSNTAGKSDDHEPSNTASTPIYMVLERNKLTSKAIFVVRYFGGVKLGAGGLIRAYAKSANDLID